MGMRENPCQGYIVKAEDLVKLLPEEHRAEALSLMDNWNEGGLPEFFSEHLPSKFPEPVEFFQLADEDTPDSENMERGVLYALFDEADLYTKVERPALLGLQENGVKPEPHSWSIWG